MQYEQWKSRELRRIRCAVSWLLQAFEHGFRQQVLKLLQAGCSHVASLLRPRTICGWCAAASNMTGHDFHGQSTSLSVCLIWHPFPPLQAGPRGAGAGGARGGGARGAQDHDRGRAPRLGGRAPQGAFFCCPLWLPHPQPPSSAAALLPMTCHPARTCTTISPLESALS